MTDKKTTALARLQEVLDLETLELNLFRGLSPKDGWQRVYGGQVIGQALVAASRTVEGRDAHSLHGYFMRPGDPTVPIIYEVDRIRDGGSFTTRRVVALQHGKAIFSMSASFHNNEEDALEHASEMPDVPPPDKLIGVGELAKLVLDKLPDNMKAYFTNERPIHMRPTDVSRYMSREAAEPQQAIWIKANGSLPDVPALHKCVLAYASDFTLLDTALIAHGKVMFDPSIMMASLDHAMWFHRPFRADEWLLYVQDSPNAAGSRGFCRGSVYSQSGKLVASVTQEGLIRKRSR